MNTQTKRSSSLGSFLSDFNLELKQFKPLIDHYILSVLDTRVKAAAKIDQRYEKLWSHIRDTAVVGGKRIRPFLVVTGYGSRDKAILPVAAAQEFIHIAMLMHDDVIDQDTIRHGVKNMNGLYMDEYSAVLSDTLSRHFSNSAGMLAGDLLISEAYNQLNTTIFDSSTVLALQKQLTKAIFEVVGGELLDVEASIITDTNFDPYTIYRYKTASYSFVCPLLSGAICAQLESSELNALKQFGTSIGIAYQIQDDLIGVFGDKSKTGKSTLSDLREGKQTLLINIHKERMTKSQQRSMNSFGSQTATNQELHQLKNDIDRSGAKAETQKIMKQYFKKASLSLSNISDGTRKSTLESLTALLQSREA